MVEVISSQRVFSGRAFNVRVDQVRVNESPPRSWEVVEHTGAVTMVPVDEEGNVWMVRQYRHSAAAELLELPAGTVEPGEDPDATAARELQEEIGMAAADLKRIGEFFLAPGYSSELMRLYLAQGLTPAALPPDADEDIRVEKIPFPDAVRMAIDGQIRDAKSVAGLLLAAHRR